MPKLKSAEISPNHDPSSELLLPAFLFHVAPMDRHQSIAEHGIIPRDDPRNPGGVSGVSQMGDEYQFPGRIYLSVEPYQLYRGDRVEYAIDTSKLDPRLFQIDEDNYPLGPGHNHHRPELDTPENINLALEGLPGSPGGVSGLKRSVAYQGTVPAEALIPVKAHKSVGDSIWDREIDPPTTGLEGEEIREFAKKLAAISASHQGNADKPTTLGAGDL